MTRNIRIVLLIVIGLLTASCVIHEPMSELVMYDKFSDSQKMIQVSSEFMMSDINKIYEEGSDDNRFRDLLWLNIDPESSSYFPRLHAPFALSRVIKFRENAAFGLSQGIGINGFDATLPMPYSNFITMGISLYSGAQVIVQRKVYESNKMGFSVGAGYKYEGLFFSSLFNEHVFFMQQYGVRTHTIWVPNNLESYALKTTFFGGYAHRLERPVFTVGISLVRF